MRLSLAVVGLMMGLSAAILGQAELNLKGQPMAKNGQNAPVELKAGETITRGAMLVKGTKKVALDKVLDAPHEYAGKTVAVEGVIVRSCKKEGCWMDGFQGRSEIGPRDVRRSRFLHPAQCRRDEGKGPRRLQD